MRTRDTQSHDFNELEQGKITKKSTDKPKKVTHKKSESFKDLEQLAFENLIAKFPSFPFPPKPKYNDNTANGLTKCIVDYITFRGFHAERINTTGQQIKVGDTTKWIKGSSEPGSSDVSAIIQGYAVRIEIKCKETKDRQSEAQKEYQRKVEQAGGTYLVITEFEEFHNWFNRKKVKP